MIMKTKEWHNRKSKDVYIKKASKLGFVSRSAFKLIEMEKNMLGYLKMASHTLNTFKCGIEINQ